MKTPRYPRITGWCVCWRTSSRSHFRSHRRGRHHGASGEPTAPGSDGDPRSKLRDAGSILDGTDLGAATRLLLDHFGDSEDKAAAAVDHLAMSVEGCVWDHWDTIALVAVSLLRYRRLTSDEFRSIVPPMRPGAVLGALDA